MAFLPFKNQIVLSALAFVLTVVIGSWFSGAFEGYVVKFYIQPTFTMAEAEALVGKKVVLTHKKLEGARGRIVSTHRANDGQVFVEINFPKFLDKTDQTVGYCKNSFRTGHVVIVD